MFPREKKKRERRKREQREVSGGTGSCWGSLGPAVALWETLGPTPGPWKNPRTVPMANPRTALDSGGPEGLVRGQGTEPPVCLSGSTASAEWFPGLPLSTSLSLDESLGLPGPQLSHLMREE